MILYNLDIKGLQKVILVTTNNRNQRCNFALVKKKYVIHLLDILEFTNLVINRGAVSTDFWHAPAEPACPPGIASQMFT